MQSIHVTPSLAKAVRNSQISGTATCTDEMPVTSTEKAQIFKVFYKNNIILNEYETTGDNWS